jgi:hypothetical protein
MTCGIGPETDLNTKYDKYKMLRDSHWGGFATIDFKNNKINRFIRLKMFHIWLELIGVVNGQRHPKIKDYYSVEFYDKKSNGRVSYRECVDYSYLIKDFKTIFHSEYISFFWTMWRVFGSYKMGLNFNAEDDTREFGKIGETNYYANAVINVDTYGRYDFELSHELKTEKPFNEIVNLKGSFNEKR